MENDDSSSFGDSILLHPDHGLSRQTKYGSMFFL